MTVCTKKEHLESNPAWPLSLHEKPLTLNFNYSSDSESDENNHDSEDLILQGRSKLSPRPQPREGNREKYLRSEAARREEVVYGHSERI